MRQPQKWVLGLLPLAVLFLLAGFWKQGSVEADLAARGGAGLVGAGLPWAKVELSGRDVRIVGEAPTPEARAQAIAVSEGIFGVRRANDAMTVLPEAKPFVFTALRDGTKITLTGSVPPGATRAAVLEAIKAAAPTASVVDNLKNARGASEQFGQLAAFGLAELGKLSEGTLSISDATLSLSGRAADFAGSAALRTRLGALPAGARLNKGLAPGDILPPVAKPFSFSAERVAGGVTLSGFVVSEDAKARLLADARALGPPVRDSLQVADGAPAGDWTMAASLLVRELARLESGKAALMDEKASIVGKGRDLVAEDDVRADLKGLPAGYALTQVAIESRAVRPYLFSATRGEGGLTLAGYVPDSKTKAEILDTARRYFEGDRIEDKLVEALGAPKDFALAIRVGLQELSRLATGATLSLTDGGLTVKGLALFDAAREQVATALRRDLPAGLKTTLDLGTAPLPPPITLSAECQLLYRELLQRGTVRFKSGSADLSEESRAILDRLTVVTLRCVNARIEIGGHTDSDGNAQANAELSRRRAETVAIYFTQAGIPAARLEAAGYGQTAPVAPNDTAENKAKNRRIEFSVK
ncbi:MAG: hypothetical protein FD175_1362 [Beijerinckiaceae bacterium]|nr:MAG: hypothetical protein FD175_1362 [Beijerinckiaceae bacterium]